MVAKVKNGFSIDITVGGPNDMKGIYNSLALNILGRIDERFRVMFCALKTWARNINDPKKGTLNSFSLVLLVQSFLFTWSIIPNIFKKYPDIYKETKIHNFASSKLHYEIAAELKNEIGLESSGVVSLLTSFFEWFSNIKFFESAVDSRSGELVQRPRGEGAPFQNDLIVILEPFAQEANSARAVNSKGWKEIKTHLRRTVESARSRDWLEWQELLGIYEPSWPRCGPPRIKAINDNDSDDDLGKLLLKNKTIVNNMQKFASTPAKNSEAYDPEQNWKLGESNSKEKVQYSRRVFHNSKIYGIMTVLVLMLTCGITNASFSTPMICHNEGNSKFVKISKEKSTCLNLDKLFDEPPIALRLNLYRPDQKEYEVKARMCAVVKHTAKFWTNLLNDPFTNVQQMHVHTSKEECEEMIKTNVCKYGNLFGDPNAIMTTNNKLEFAHTFWSIGKSETSVINCMIKTIVLISHPGREDIVAPSIDVSHCKYSEGNCHIENESVVVWTVEPTEGVNAFW
ncbi:hypothetical protein ACQ4LE_004908 [Meloidogyne hapla]